MAAITLKPNSVMKMRHSAHGGRSTTEHKQVRIERPKSTTPAIRVDDDSDVQTDKADDLDHGHNKWRETTMFLTAARRISQNPSRRCSTPLEVQDLTEEELDSYYFEGKYTAC